MQVPVANEEAQGAKIPSYEYTSFPRRFVGYRWFKPLLSTVLAMVLIVLATLPFAYAVNLVNGGVPDGYDGIDFTSGVGAFINMGNVAVWLLCIAVALLIVRDRPWSSLSSSRGGFNWKTFFKCLLPAAVIVVAVQLIAGLINPDGTQAPHVVLFSVAGFFMVTILAPLQCAAEEYAFRGMLMQTLGSWVKVPIIPVIIQSLAFCAMHSYNFVGLVGIFVSGTVFGVLAWRTRGLEAPLALHVANNMFGFYAVGFGFGVISSESTLASVAASALAYVIYLVFVLVVGKKRGWFEPRYDGTAKFNAKKQAKLDAKAVR